MSLGRITVVSDAVTYHFDTAEVEAPSRALRLDTTNGSMTLPLALEQGIQRPGGILRPNRSMYKLTQTFQDPETGVVATGSIHTVFTVPKQVVTMSDWETLIKLNSAFLTLDRAKTAVSGVLI